MCPAEHLQSRNARRITLREGQLVDVSRGGGSLLPDSGKAKARKRIRVTEHRGSRRDQEGLRCSSRKQRSPLDT